MSESPEWLTVRQTAERLSLSEETVRRMIRNYELPASREHPGARAPWLINALVLERRLEADARRKRLEGMGGGYGPAGTEAAVAAAGEFNGWTPEQHAEALERLHERARQQELLDRVQREMSTDLRRQFEELDEDIAIERTAQEIARRVRREERVRKRAAQILAADDDEHHDA